MFYFLYLLIFFFIKGFIKLKFLCLIFGFLKLFYLLIFLLYLIT